MRIALILLVALACVALVAAGSGKGKDKKSREGKSNKNAEKWEGKKSNKEGSKKQGRKEEIGKKDEKKWQENKENGLKDKKRSKREEPQTTQDESQPAQEQRTKESNHKIKPDKASKKEKRSSEEPPSNNNEQPAKKKSKNTETPQKKEEIKKTKSKKVDKSKKQEDQIIEEAKEETTIEIEEDQPETIIIDEVEGEGECTQEPTEECGDEPEVTLSSGAKVKGKKGKTQEGRDTAEFTGVPYAEPPVGKDRLKEPVLKDYWEGVLQATTPENDCLQYSHFTYTTVGSEDCLYLNVYTPKVPKGDQSENELLPVIVWIHGGAFMFFSAAIAGPRYLLDKDVVLVTLNYRLGPLGFFSLGDDTVPGNLGLRDQMTAIKWVQKNIKSFGGDPKQVTISGMSAGGASVHYHMLSPLTKGLFSKAISMSGVALNPWAEVESVVDKSLELVRKVGCDAATSQEMVSCLRTRTGEKLVSTGKDMQVWLYYPFSPWAPSPEPKSAVNPFLPDYPINIMLDGKSQDVPWLVSWTSMEGGYPGSEFIFNSTLLDYLENNWLEVAPHLLEYNFTASSEKLNEISNNIKQFYLRDKAVNHPESAGPLIDMQSDRLFLEGIAEAIRAYVNKYKSPIFTYRFSHVGEDSVTKVLCHCNQTLDGACHADDVGYLFEAISPILKTSEEFQISKDMVDMWYSFITTGVPKYGKEALPRVSKSSDSIPFLDIGPGGKTSLMSDADLGNQAFWLSLGFSDMNGRAKKEIFKDEL